MVKNTSLSDIMERDTDTDVMQADAFLTAERHASDVKAEDPNAPQLIIGTTARDNIQGGPADDTLVASGNVQSVTGGGGNDTFVFDFGTADHSGWCTIFMPATCWRSTASIPPSTSAPCR